MAPVMPLGKDRALQLVREGQFPIWFGSPHPHTAIVEQDGVFRIRELVVDLAESAAAGERARAAGEAFMPEHHYALGKPTGTIYLEAPTRDELIAKMRVMDWPGDW